jgi:hypothetical protein
MVWQEAVIRSERTRTDRQVWRYEPSGMVAAGACRTDPRNIKTIMEHLVVVVLRRSKFRFIQIFL